MIPPRRTARGMLPGMPTFTNWARNVRSNPASRQAPATAEQVADAVRAARREGKRVKVVGAGHSWSAIAAPESIWLSADRLDRVGRVDNGVVSVGGGVRLWDLVRALAEQGCSPSVLGSVAEQRIAGAIATGTHGSSLTHGNLASFVRGMTLVDGRGEIVEIGPGDERLAAAVHLGALGVVTELKLAVEPTFCLREELIPTPLDQSVRDLESIARSAEYVKWWWLPHTDEAMIFAYHRDPGPGREPKLARWLDEAVINRFVFPGLLAVSRALPGLTPLQNRLVAASYFRPGQSVDRVDRQLTLAMPPRHQETEWSVPMDRAREAVSRLIEVIRGGGLKVNFILEVRFVKGDEGWLSPASGGDRCAIGAYITRGRHRAPYFARVAEVMRALDGRPHWGKEAAFSPAAVDRAYPYAERFRALARELDPDGIFRNRYLDEVVGR